MIEQLKTAWDDYVHPMLQRPKRLQVAALCYRGDGPERQVLLITSRDTGRWIIPKGWPIPDLDSPESAMQEAWEEAGVLKGRTGNEPVGSYVYDKRFSTGWSVPIETLVFPVVVEELTEDFPEAEERRRKWVAPGEAAEMVDEPELGSILRSL